MACNTAHSRKHTLISLNFVERAGQVLTLPSKNPHEFLKVEDFLHDQTFDF